MKLLPPKSLKKSTNVMRTVCWYITNLPQALYRQTTRTQASRARRFNVVSKHTTIRSTKHVLYSMPLQSKNNYHSRYNTLLRTRLSVTGYLPTLHWRNRWQTGFLRAYLTILSLISANIIGMIDQVKKKLANWDTNVGNKAVANTVRLRTLVTSATTTD